MVIKYNTCSFSENKIAPGHGLKYCEVNGKTHMFITKKVHRLYLHGKKPLNIRWSLKWRNAHKKGKVEEAKKKVNRQKKERQVKAIVGLSLEEINKIKESFKDTKVADAERFNYAKAIKEKRKKYLEKVKKLRGDNRPKDNFAKNVKGTKGLHKH
jgi:large subunit ribosomal protein L24e